MYLHILGQNIHFSVILTLKDLLFALKQTISAYYNFVNNSGISAKLAGIMLYTLAYITAFMI